MSIVSSSATSLTVHIPHIHVGILYKDDGRNVRMQGCGGNWGS